MTITLNPQMMRSKPTMPVERNRKIKQLIEIPYLFSGTAVQGGGKKDSKDFNEAQNIMSKIFAKASSEEPSGKQTNNSFSGSGKILFCIILDSFSKR